MRTLTQDQGRGAKPQVWTIECKGNKVITTWGQQGGAMQTTTQTFEAVNVGKSNEKSPETVAREFMDRTIKKKSREGYYEGDEGDAGTISEKRSFEIDFNAPLPLNLRFFKPQNSMNGHVQKKLKSGEAVALRKRDGMMHVAVWDEDGEPTLYGSNMLPDHKDEPGIPWLERYPHLRKELRALDLRNSILLGELVTVSTSGFEDGEGYDKDDFTYVGSIVKSKKTLALTKQEEGGRLGFCAWDVAFWQGNCWLQERPAEERFLFLQQLFVPDENTWKYPHLRMPEMIFGWDEGQLLAYAKEHKWEGFVVVDKMSKYDDRAYNFHGKAERPKEVCKLKPTLEADFIVRWDPDNGIGAYGKGKKSGGVGAVAAYLWDGKKEVYVCDIGGGLTDANVTDFADPGRYPKVWQVEFNEWTPKGALRFPVFLRERDDKTPEECELSQRPAADDDTAES